MSLSSLIEVAIHLESFRNVDLFYQGIYFTRSRVYHNSQDIHETESAKPKFAIPYSSHVSQNQEIKA